ncbi:mitochondrial fission 1 protein-like [Crassostrea angulata]|uniref:Mitochondrial fission 1 protein n=1 Tax=Magallana gigas TaxID=29159 RepID=A0A8W8IZE2_MAGGI|nr:mitochondrial fission 1 protein [Crassostrea gigas]XP_052705669.1 mitochondrial fission 1 protein-like [Crassostrea angulata]|eukprot:XP_011449152.1 PREDICTED: mitochondrial fission 1 protein [Crassostrea gigas]
MESILNEEVDPADLKRFELMYNEQVRRGQVSEKAKFEYAWCLVRSKYIDDMKEGVALLEDLFKRASDDGARRDYLYYMSVGYTRIKEYPQALKYVKALLKIEPGNHQALQLEKFINKKMTKEGIMGMAIVGGAALALGGLVSLGIALAKK